MLRKKPVYTDQHLIESIQSGGKKREEAITILFDLHRGFLFKIKRKLFLSEEELQDAYVDSILKVGNQITLGKFRGDSKLSTYLYSIFFNKCVDLSRRKKSNQITLVEPQLEMEDAVGNLWDLMEVKDELKQLKSALSKMGENCQHVLLDWGYYGYSMEEIAERRNLKNPQSAKSLKYKCLKKLRELLNIKKLS
ncbi:MAG: sigma-70 family RNA polymerase sigma factor [Bacteroidota bacterium]